MKATSYKTHFLIGFPHFGNPDGKVVARWEYVPPAKELQAALDAAAKDYTGFVLVSPVGEALPGNYVSPTPTYDYYG